MDLTNTFTADINAAIQRKLKIYPNNNTFYETPPKETIPLDEFESLAEKRLKFLRVIEKINSLSVERYSNVWVDNIEKEFKNDESLKFLYNLRDGTNMEKPDDIENLLKWRRDDYLSHYILRLAYSRTEDLRRWFISMEIDFFIYKSLDAKHFKKFIKMKKGKNSFEMASKDEIEEHKENIINSSYRLGDNRTSDSDIYKVPFTKVLDLVKGRKVFLYKGDAFVPHGDLISIITADFRANLSKAMARMSKSLSELAEEDERFADIILCLHQKDIGTSDVVTKEGGVSLKDLPGLAKKSFPLCMRSLYTSLTTDFHLKHWARIQLGLFIKGIGLTLNDSIQLWRSNFTKKGGMDDMKFDKAYLYNIRHSYGKEGKRADYTPHSCMKIIMSNVGPGENHGCPFRHSDENSLRAKLVEAGIPHFGINEVIKEVAAQHYQIACQKVFEFTHNKMTIGMGVNHPNQYFIESQNVLTGKATTVAAPKIQTNKVNVMKEYKTQPPTPPSQEALSDFGDAEMDEETLELENLYLLANANTK